MRIDDLEAGSAARRRAQGLRRNVEITDAAILLGAGILLAGLSLDGAEPRLLALLAAAFGCAASPRILDVMQKATGLWKGGEKFRAQLHLTYARLPPLTEEQAFALCAADELLKAGMTPRALMKGLGLDPAALDGLDKYNPDKPRVPAGSGRLCSHACFPYIFLDGGVCAVDRCDHATELEPSFNRKKEFLV